MKSHAVQFSNICKEDEMSVFFVGNDKQFPFLPCFLNKQAFLRTKSERVEAFSSSDSVKVWSGTSSCQKSTQMNMEENNFAFRDILMARCEAQSAGTKTF